MVNASVVGYIVSNMHIGMEEHIILVSPKAISSLYHYKTGRDISLYQPHTNFIPPSYQFYTYLIPILYLPCTKFIPTSYHVNISLGTNASPISVPGFNVKRVKGLGLRVLTYTYNNAC